VLIFPQDLSSVSVCLALLFYNVRQGFVAGGRGGYSGAFGWIDGVRCSCKLNVG
jgi:hypothetical protein